MVGLRNQIEFLAPEEVTAIHEASMALLSKTGVAFHSEKAIATFKEHGVEVAGNLVYLQEKQVMEAVAAAPAQFTIRGRQPDKDVVVGGNSLIFVPGYGAPFILEPEVGRRSPTLDDYHRLIRLADVLPNQDLSGHMLVLPSDVPEGTAHLHMNYAAMIHSDKPFLGSTESALAANQTMEMAAISFGEATDSLRERPVTVALVDSLSPLQYSQEMIEALMTYASWGQAIMIAALVMAGATGPITLAGVLAQQNAEILAGVTLAQFVRPGTPVIYGATSTNMDMKSGALAIGSPELSIIASASAQMARYYGLPSRCGGALTDANSPDAQAGFESMFSLLTAANSGADIVLHAAGILSSFLAFSYEKFVIDDEVCGMVRRYHQGIAVNQETLAVEVTNKVGPGGNFLREPHTVSRCREAFWEPALCDRDGLERWLANGQPSLTQQASKRWQDLLAEQKDPVIDATTKRQLGAYMADHGCSLVGEERFFAT